MEGDQNKETNPPETPPVMEDTNLDNNQDNVDTVMTTTASTAVETGTQDPEANTGAPTPMQASMDAYIARNANTLANTAKSTPSLGWGQGHVVNASAHVPDDSETTAEARNKVINGLAQTHPDDVDESVLDNNVEFVLSRLNLHESDVRKEWTTATSELLQRAKHGHTGSAHPLLLEGRWRPLQPHSPPSVGSASSPTPPWPLPP